MKILDLLATFILFTHVAQVTLDLFLSLLDAVLYLSRLLLQFVFLHFLYLCKALLSWNLVRIFTHSLNLLLDDSSLSLDFVHLVQVSEQAFLFRLLLFLSFAYVLLIDALGSLRCLHLSHLQLLLLRENLLVKRVLGLDEARHNLFFKLTLLLGGFVTFGGYELAVLLVTLELLLELCIVLSLLLGLSFLPLSLFLPGIPEDLSGRFSGFLGALSATLSLQLLSLLLLALVILVFLLDGFSDLLVLLGLLVG